ncbi:MAG: colanic acid biosynthesis glycosyltransferase WcaI [Sphingopyxis sp.]|nr:MAG: colanic acid biosynthesis glycosyltransferase WcaI [Sphingopyxis sp.]
MKILLYGINYRPELTGIGKYTGEMAQWLKANGHEVTVVTAPPYYPEWRVREGYHGHRWDKRLEDGIKVIRCPLYVPSRVSALKRIVHLSSFALSSLLPLLLQARSKPDLVIQVAPTLFCSPGAILAARLASARSVLHIQDYEVDALFGLGIARPGKLRRFAYACERFLLRGFDRVSTISSGMIRRAEEKGVDRDRLVFFPNWSETERFSNVPRSAALLAGLSVPAGKQVVLYAGNMGDKQGLEQVIEAASAMRDRTQVHFLLVGDGAGKERLVDLAREHQLRNVTFAPLQSYEQLPSLLASADVHLVIQKRGAADAVLPSKLTNILAAGGNAVITADPDTTLGALCQDHPGIAVCVEPESVDALIAGIEEAFALPEFNQPARRYAEEYLAKDRILQRFIAEVTPDVAGR